jgi:hypothetical protein
MPTAIPVLPVSIVTKRTEAIQSQKVTAARLFSAPEVLKFRNASECTYQNN